MKKIIYYGIIEESTMFFLSERINKLITEGCQPIGGVNVIPSTNFHGVTFYQAIVKYED
jgi:hypothetical protein